MRKMWENDGKMMENLHMKKIWGNDGSSSNGGALLPQFSGKTILRLASVKMTVLEP